MNTKGPALKPIATRGGASILPQRVEGLKTSLEILKELLPTLFPTLRKK